MSYCGKGFNTVKNKNMKLALIVMPIYSDLVTYFGAVINYGQITQGCISYLSKDGEKTSKLSEIESCFKIIPCSGIDYKRSLYHWIKSNPIHHDKQFVLDELITTGEVYKQYGWRFSLMIQVGESNIKVKPIFD